MVSPGLAQKVREVVQSCDACQRIKPTPKSTKEETVKLSASEKCEKVYVDICGPLRETRKKKRYIMAMVDHFSRYVILRSISKQDEHTIVETIKDGWVNRFGSPREIHTDCGKAFESKVFQEWVKEIGTEVRYSSPYHHNTNGVVERQFRTVRDYVDCCLKEMGNGEWDILLPDIEFTLNATVQGTLGKSPAEVMFGKKLSKEGWIPEGRTEIEEPSQIKTRRIFQTGDTVLIRNENRTKGQDRFVGPYRIAGRIHGRRYLLEGETGKFFERNVEKIRRFKP